MTTASKNQQMIILGSGTSTGIPMLGCSCAVCSSDDPHDKRLRTSLLIQTSHGENILIDTGPDLRTQLLRAKPPTIDAAIITHDHADHLHGLDDLRPYCFGPPKKSIPIYSDDQTLQSIRSKFSYIFDQKTPVLGGGIPQLELKTITADKQKIQIGKSTFQFFHNPHGHGQSLAFVHQKCAVILDCHQIHQEQLEWLASLKLELLIIDCVQEKPHQTHLWLERTIAYAKAIKAERTGLIHMGHYLSHQQLQKLPDENIFPTFDQQVLSYH